MKGDSEVEKKKNIDTKVIVIDVTSPGTLVAAWTTKRKDVRVSTNPTRACISAQVRDIPLHDAIARVSSTALFMYVCIMPHAIAGLI